MTPTIVIGTIRSVVVAACFASVAGIVVVASTTTAEIDADLEPVFGYRVFPLRLPELVEAPSSIPRAGSFLDEFLFGGEVAALGQGDFQAPGFFGSLSLEFLLLCAFAFFEFLAAVLEIPPLSAADSGCVSFSC